MKYSTFLSVGLEILSAFASVAFASPTNLHTRSIHKRAVHYLDRFLTAAQASRSFYSIAPMCRGEGCPSTPEELMCHERTTDYIGLHFPADPTNVTGVADANAGDIKTESNEMFLCIYLSPVDERCTEVAGVLNPWGISDAQAARETAEFGFAGCPGSPEQLLSKVMKSLKWTEEKARRMLDTVGPGWEEMSQIPVERKRPFNIPSDAWIMMLPPGPIQKAISGCSEWTVARRGETCPKIVRRLNISLEYFLAMNGELVGGDDCPHLLAGYAYCIKDRIDRSV
ncbi:hypothetical protein BJ508DRAFT_361723 [Ascobolus immersus RN42]|uniref:LysM domain-containing protein n=1 Tax=Ascobolus immersus RN42 TaxID=1160509 RepID=A0A3N4IAL7_ASCIM|nr:hypothetical protein BJ508DRAFT_361723 [Ascobolus immersus RN42]